MTEVETLLRATIAEMERLLTSKTVIGDPITAGEKTVVPLLTVGAGFGVGAGSGKENEGSGGAGGGFGMKPVAVIIIEKDAVWVEPVREGGSSILDRVVERVPQLIKKEIEEWEQGREEKKEKREEEKREEEKREEEKREEEKREEEKAKGKEIKAE